MKSRLFDVFLVAVLVAVWVMVASLATAGPHPLVGDTGAGIVDAGAGSVRSGLASVKEIMTWVVDNKELVAAFVLALVGFYGTITQARGKRAAVSALDLVTTSVEIAEGTIPRENRPVKRQVESATPVLGRLALRLLENSIKKASE